MKTQLIVAILLLACAGYSYATMCVVCSSLTNSKCNDLYDVANNDALKQNCTYGCKKGKVNTAGVVVTGRECASSAKTAKCDFSEINFFINIKTWTCYCDGDLCNGATQMALPVSTLIMSVVVAIKSMF